MSPTQICSAVLSISDMSLSNLTGRLFVFLRKYYVDPKFKSIFLLIEVQKIYIYLLIIPIITMSLKIFISLFDHCDPENEYNRQYPRTWINRSTAVQIKYVTYDQYQQKICICQATKLLQQIKRYKREKSVFGRCVPMITKWINYYCCARIKALQ